MKCIGLLFVLTAALLAGRIQAAPTTSATRPAAHDEAFTTARKLAAKGDHTAALEKYSEALKSDPQNGVIFAYRALSYLALNRMPEAQRDIDQATQLAEKEPVVWEAAGQLKIAQNQIPQGRALFEKAAKLSPATAGDIYTDLAAALSSHNDPKLASDIEASLKSAAAANPPSAEALYQLGQAYANAGKPEGRGYLQRYIDVTSKLPPDQRDAQKIQLAKQLIKALDVVKSLGQ